MGGEANAEIDHFCPVSVCPDLETTYTNLCLCCAECNGKKRETWPTAKMLAKGTRFLDPCKDDHIKHWEVNAGGKLVSKTKIGDYTIDKIGLDRESLNYHRHKVIASTEKAKSILMGLHDPLMTDEEIKKYKNRFAIALEECMDFLEPLIFPKSVYQK